MENISEATTAESGSKKEKATKMEFIFVFVIVVAVLNDVIKVDSTASTSSPHFHDTKPNPLTQAVDVKPEGLYTFRVTSFCFDNVILFSKFIFSNDICYYGRSHVK